MNEENKTEEIAKEAAEISEESPENNEDSNEELTELLGMDHEALAAFALEKLKEADRNKDSFLRKSADMENLKKRTEKERAELLAFANEKLLLDILPLIDNMERALIHSEAEDGTALKEGVAMSIKQFNDTMERFGLTPIEALGEPFDPNLHEAVSSVENSELTNDTIAEELQKGYKLNSKVIRHSMVVVVKNG